MSGNEKIGMPKRIEQKKKKIRRNLWFHSETVNTHSSEGVVQIVKSPRNYHNVIDI